MQPGIVLSLRIVFVFFEFIIKQFLQFIIVFVFIIVFFEFV